MNKRRTNRFVITGLVAFAFCMPFAANAASPSQFEDVSVTVSFADLNIDSVKGAIELYARLQRATKQACNVQSLRITGSMRSHAKSMECYNDVLDAAVREIDSDVLTDVHNT